jgi:flagellar L-ring protein precursor FlgH
MFLFDVHRLICITTLCAVFLSGCSIVPEKNAAPDSPRWAPAIPQPRPQTTNVIHSSLFSVARSRNLFEDRTPFQVGDILTVRLKEKTSSQKSAGTTMDKNSAATVPNPLFLGQLHSRGINIAAERQFQGKTNSSMNNSLAGDITVSVAEVLSNGVLRLVGEKWMRLNQGDEYIRIEGMVRPEDVSPDNVVMSMRLANARIVYSGAGPLNDSNDPGWLTRFFNSPIVPI